GSAVTCAAARMVSRIGLVGTIGIGAVALAGGGLTMCAALMLGATSVVWIVLPTTLYLFGLGLAMPQAMAGALTPVPDRARAASSLAGFFHQGRAAVPGRLVGHFIGASAWPIAAPLALMGVAALTVCVTAPDVRELASRG